MRWIDGHLDLAYIDVGGRDIRREAPDPAKGCLSLPAMRQAGVEIAFATIFTEPGVFGEDHPNGYPGSDDVDAAELAGLRQYEVYSRLQTEREISIVRSKADLQADNPMPKIVLMMEGADPIRSPEHVKAWFDRGLRIVGLTWAAGTRYAGGNTDGGPLKPLGTDLIRAMDALGIIHDASHLSDAAFDGVMANAKGRVIASHSNCRALLENKQRHLRDDQIRAIGERDGIIGLNLYSNFLSKGRRATVEDCVAHVQRIVEVMGHKRGVALGSDMDGGFPPKDLPEDLDHPSKLPRLLEALRNMGWSEQEVEGFAYGNWLRLLDATLV